QFFRAPHAGLNAFSIGVADESCRINNENHALRMIEDLSIEVVLALELSLDALNLADVENNSAKLADFSPLIPDGKARLQDGKKGTILASQDDFRCFHGSDSGEGLLQSSSLGRRCIHLRRNIYLKQLLPAAIAEHPHEGVIDFQEVAIRSREVGSFLEIVKEFAIKTLSLPVFGYVTKNMNRLSAFFTDADQLG